MRRTRPQHRPLNDRPTLLLQTRDHLRQRHRRHEAQIQIPQEDMTNLCLPKKRPRVIRQPLPPAAKDR